MNTKDILRNGGTLQITEDVFYEALEVMPPIYINAIGEGIKPAFAFAVAEPVNYGKKGMIYNIYYQTSPTDFFRCYAEIQKPNGEYIMHPDYAQYTKGNKAILL